MTLGSIFSIGRFFRIVDELVVPLQSPKSWPSGLFAHVYSNSSVLIMFCYKSFHESLLNSFFWSVFLLSAQICWTGSMFAQLPLGQCFNVVVHLGNPFERRCHCRKHFIRGSRFAFGAERLAGQRQTVECEQDAGGGRPAARQHHRHQTASSESMH